MCQTSTKSTSWTMDEVQKEFGIMTFKHRSIELNFRSHMRVIQIAVNIHKTYFTNILRGFGDHHMLPKIDLIMFQPFIWKIGT